MSEMTSEEKKKLDDDKKKLEKRKKSRIKKEIDRLTLLFSEMPKNIKEKVVSLIYNAAFMTITLEDLQSAINEKGMIEKYQNGANQEGFKKSTEVEIYNTMIKNHMSVIKQLTDLTPASDRVQPPAGGALAQIIKREQENEQG